jgi:hypothetical protein
MHSCPDCGCACYCGGDIDDAEVGDENAEDNCTHCDEGITGDPEGDVVFDPDYQDRDPIDDPRPLGEEGEL